MTIESSYISLKDMRFHAFHGVLPQERQVGNDYLVSLRIGYDMTAALKHDMLEVTLNYSELYDTVKAEMAKPSHLIEYVAGRIGNAVFVRFPQVTSLELSLTKLNPPMEADCLGAAVEIKMVR